MKHKNLYEKKIVKIIKNNINTKLSDSEILNSSWENIGIDSLVLISIIVDIEDETGLLFNDNVLLIQLSSRIKTILDFC